MPRGRAVRGAPALLQAEHGAGQRALARGSPPRRDAVSLERGTTGYVALLTNYQPCANWDSSVGWQMRVFILIFYM